MKTTDKPILQDFHIEGVKHINPSDALEAIKSGEAVMHVGYFPEEELVKILKQQGVK